MNINELRRALIRSNRGILSIEGIQIPVQIDNVTQRPEEPTEITLHDVTLRNPFDLKETLERAQRAYTSYSSYYVGGVSESNVKIEKVIFNNPATIVLWSDGTKTVVKCQDGDIFDPEKGLAMAISKKAMGNKGNYCDQIKKWTEKYYDSNIAFGKVAYTANGSKLTGKLELNISEKLKDAVKSAVDAANKFAASTKSCKLKEPDIDTKRQMLGEYCNDRFCSNCPVNGAEFNCGRGLSFEKHFPEDRAIVSEEEVNKAFKIAFPEFEGGDK